MNPDLWARIDRVLAECDARQLEPLTQDQIDPGDAAFLIPIDEIWREHDATEPKPRRRQLPPLPLYGQCPCGTARRWDSQRLYCPTCDAPPPPAEPPPPRPRFRWPWSRP